MSDQTIVKVKDSNTRLAAELKELVKQNKPLYDLVFDLADHIKETFKKDLIITMIYRTEEEQEAIYKDDKKYKEKKFKSPHQFWHSVDIRSKVFSKEEIKAIEEFANNKYNPTNFYKWTARNHVVGAGAEHFHIQYVEQKKKV